MKNYIASPIVHTSTPLNQVEEERLSTYLEVIKGVTHTQDRSGYYGNITNLVYLLSQTSSKLKSRASFIKAVESTLSILGWLRLGIMPSIGEDISSTILEKEVKLL